MKTAFLMLLISCLAFGQANTLTPAEKAEGWVLLFNGKDLSGWSEQGKAKWRVEDGILIGDSPESGWLRTNEEFGNFLLKLDFRTGPGGQQRRISALG